MKKCISQYTNLNITFEDIKEPGIAYGIKSTYLWLQKEGIDFVYQVQDDYLFQKTAILEMYELQVQLFNETKGYLIISPWNDNWLWMTAYRNRATPRTIICGKYRYWIQYYDMSCSFFTHHSIFSKHWDLYHAFFKLLDGVIKEEHSMLENKSINYMLTQRGELGLVPINILAFHLQSDLDMDPYVDYKPYFDNVNVD